MSNQTGFGGKKRPLSSRAYAKSPGTKFGKGAAAGGTAGAAVAAGLTGISAGTCAPLIPLFAIGGAVVGGSIGLIKHFLE